MDMTDDVYAAIFRAQKKMTAAKKTSNNPFFKSKYADLGSVLDACETALNDEGVMILQPVNKEGVDTCLIHVESNQKVTCFVPFIGAVDMQKLGGAITYARRYGLQSLLCLETEDDDGNTAVGHLKKETTGPVTAPTIVDLIKKMPAENQPLAMKLLAAAATDQSELKKLHDRISQSLKEKK